MKFISFFATHLTGFDIQPDAVRVVQLAKRKREFRLQRMETIRLPAGIFVDGKIKHWELLQSALALACKELRLYGSAVIALSSSLVRRQQIQVPSSMQPAQIENEVFAHLQRDLPGMTEALSVDYACLESKQRDSIDVSFCVARQEYVQQLATCVQAAGLKVKIVDIDIYALQRALQFRLGLTSTDLYAAVYVNAQRALFIVFNSMEIVYHQEWEISAAAGQSVQLKRQLAMCLSAVRHDELTQLIVCGPKATCLALANDVNQQGHLQANYYDIVAVDHLIAYGLAMRERPVW